MSTIELWDRHRPHSGSRKQEAGSFQQPQASPHSNAQSAEHGVIHLPRLRRLLRLAPPLPSPS
ncbi:unnamed protein product, partial [Ilex paraguariensis]